MSRRAGKKAPVRFTADMADAMDFSDEDTLPDTPTSLTSFLGVPILDSPGTSSAPSQSPPPLAVDNLPPEDVIDLTSSSTPSSSSGSPMQGVLDLVQEDWVCETQKDGGPVSDTTPADAVTDAPPGELASEQEVDDFPLPEPAKSPQPTPRTTPHIVALNGYEEPPWNEATLVMQDRCHHINVRCTAWQIWAEAVRLQRIIEELEDDSAYRI